MTTLDVNNIFRQHLLSTSEGKPMQNATVKHFDVAIVGTGFSGLGMGVALKKAKKNNFVILEKAIDTKESGLKKVGKTQFAQETMIAAVSLSILKSKKVGLFLRSINVKTFLN